MPSMHQLVQLRPRMNIEGHEPYILKQPYRHLSLAKEDALAAVKMSSFQNHRTAAVFQDAVVEGSIGVSRREERSGSERSGAIGCPSGPPEGWGHASCSDHLDSKKEAMEGEVFPSLDRAGKEPSPLRHPLRGKHCNAPTTSNSLPPKELRSCRAQRAPLSSALLRPLCRQGNPPLSLGTLAGVGQGQGVSVRTATAEPFKARNQDHERHRHYAHHPPKAETSKEVIAEDMTLLIAQLEAGPEGRTYCPPQSSSFIHT